MLGELLFLSISDFVFREATKTPLTTDLQVHIKEYPGSDLICLDIPAVFTNVASVISKTTKFTSSVKWKKKFHGL